MLELRSTAGLWLSVWIVQVDDSESAGFSVTTRSRNVSQPVELDATHVAYCDVLVCCDGARTALGVQSLGRLQHVNGPALYLEQNDHLPYPATQVGYYRWMYDKDPGHQYACLGVVPPRTCANCDPVPPGDQPFEYQVYFPAGVPRPSDELWGNKLPEPINVPAPMHAESHPGPGGSPGNSPPLNGASSMLPPPPGSDTNLQAPVSAPVPHAGAPKDEAGIRKNQRDCPRSTFRLRSPSRLTTTRHP